MWYKKPKILITIIVAAVLLVVSVVGVIIGVVRHREGEFLEVCWTDEGIAQYKESHEELGVEAQENTCERYEEYIFQKGQIPITIALYDCEESPQPLQDEAQIRDIEHAVKNFNREVGFKLFKLSFVSTSNNELTGKAFIGCAYEHEFRGKNYKLSAGRVQHYKRNGRVGFYMWIRSDVASSSPMLYEVFSHELGHAVFFEHDRYKTSRMYDTISENEFSSVPNQVYISDTDRRGLIERYSTR